jgi:hypothetical protein
MKERRHRHDPPPARFLDFPREEIERLTGRAVRWFSGLDATERMPR